MLIVYLLAAVLGTAVAAVTFAVAPGALTALGFVAIPAAAMLAASVWISLVR